jgi:hypothetical protein
VAAVGPDLAGPPLLHVKWSLERSACLGGDDQRNRMVILLISSLSGQNVSLLWQGERATRPVSACQIDCSTFAPALSVVWPVIVIIISILSQLPIGTSRWVPPFHSGPAAL